MRMSQSKYCPILISACQVFTEICTFENRRFDAHFDARFDARCMAMW